MTRTTPAALALALALTMAGCSDNDGTDTSPDDLEHAVVTYTEAFGSGDHAAAIGLVSERCLTQLGANEFELAVVAAGDIYGALSVTSFDAQVDGDTASVTYDVSAPALSQVDQRWSRQGGRWKWDHC